MTIAQDGQAAVEAFRAERASFDLILMDIVMPGMDGLQAAAAIRASERESAGRVPMVAVTGRVTEEDRARCLAVGMDGVLPKPFSPEALRQTVERWAAGPGEERHAG